VPEILQTLSPFALSAPLRAAFGYYGDSVAVGLAPCRRSCFSE